MMARNLTFVCSDIGKASTQFLTLVYTLIFDSRVVANGERYLHIVRGFSIIYWPFNPSKDFNIEGRQLYSVIQATLQLELGYIVLAQKSPCNFFPFKLSSTLHLTFVSTLFVSIARCFSWSSNDISGDHQACSSWQTAALFIHPVKDLGFQSVF